MIIFIYEFVSVHHCLLTQSNIRSGRFLIMNLIFSNIESISQLLSTSSPVLDMIVYLWLWNRNPYRNIPAVSQDIHICLDFSMNTFVSIHGFICVIINCLNNLTHCHTILESVFL